MEKARAQRGRPRGGDEIPVLEIAPGRACSRILPSGSCPAGPLCKRTANTLCCGHPASQVQMSPCLMASCQAASVFLLLILTPLPCWSNEAIGPGCHLHPFDVTIKSDRRGTCRGTRVVQACVGYCESSAFPSKYSVLLASSFRHNFTSASQCCTISKMQKIKVRLRCGALRREELETFTARSCQCDMCRLSRY
ncbi:glycoprotein hormone alpha-2 [Carettochelys insculpta]|uniref:glycoprotein hormone alpha-2 n=1 Tax=Carettochelys insculpta TaxID=44489 RepID=UPI003EB736FE